MTHPLRPAHPASDPMLAIRGDEVAILREEIAKCEARVLSMAERVLDAEQGERYYRDLYRGVLKAYGTVVAERDAARATVQAMGEQAPVWESGPS